MQLLRQSSRKKGEGFQNAGSCCGALVFVDQSAKSVAALDLCAREVDKLCREARSALEGSGVRRCSVGAPILGGCLCLCRSPTSLPAGC
jgi:hypothetical protein